MKRPGLTPALVSATLFLATVSSATLVAQERMTGGAMQSQRGAEILQRFDKNGDGKLDDDERADAKEAMMQDTLNRQMVRTNTPGGARFQTQAMELFDKNRDGRLDDEERVEARKFAETMQAAMAGLDKLTLRFDQNANGRIDPEERTQIEEFLMEMRDYGAGRARVELLREFDRNTDGKIDAAEWNELEKFLRPRIESDPTQLRRHDTNGDGKLDDAEWQRARGVITQWLNTPPPAPPPPSVRSVVAEQERLAKVAAEVQRRREQREKAAEVAKVPPAPTK